MPLRFNPDAADFVPTFQPMAFQPPASAETKPNKNVVLAQATEHYSMDNIAESKYSHATSAQVKPEEVVAVTPVDEVQVQVQADNSEAPDLARNVSPPVTVPIPPHQGNAHVGRRASVHVLPRINSGLVLDQLVMDDTNMEFDFEDVLDSLPTHDRPDSPSMCPDAAAQTEILWGGEASAESSDGSASTGDTIPKADHFPSNLPSPVSDISASSPGKVNVNSFEILHMVGQGGFGKVFQVREKTSSRIYAMKCMRKDVVLRDNLRGTKAERSILSSIKHAYIVKMHYAFQCQSRLYIVMDYFPGGQFLDMLHYHAPFDEPATRLYTGEIVLALEALHKCGVVHRDLKPENILVDAEGHLVITDFGCSKQGDDDKIRTSSWAGTELYMAPEQLNKLEYGSEVDWWATGALVWEMCTGDNPFYSNNRKTIHNNILKKKLNLPAWLGPHVHSFLKGLLQRDPSKRLGHLNGAQEVKEHKFFKSLDFKKLLAREIEAPLRSHAKTDSELDISAHCARYTSALPELSPIPSPHVLSTSKQAEFEGFSWVADGLQNFPATCGSSTGLPPHMLASTLTLSHYTGQDLHIRRCEFMSAPCPSSANGAIDIPAVTRSVVRTGSGGVMVASPICAVSPPVMVGMAH